MVNAVLDTQQPHLVDPLEGSGKRSRCSGGQESVLHSRGACGDLQYSSLRDSMRPGAYAGRSK